MLIFRLHEKIRNGEIDSHFSAQDIQRVIEETLAFGFNVAAPNRERLLKNLLNYFIEHPAERKSRYMLTEYARKFIQLLEHKINNPFRKFPLRERFKRYADFSAADILLQVTAATPQAYVRSGIIEKILCHSFIADVESAYLMKECKSFGGISL